METIVNSMTDACLFFDDNARLVFSNTAALPIIARVTPIPNALIESDFVKLIEDSENWEKQLDGSWNTKVIRETNDEAFTYNVTKKLIYNKKQYVGKLIIVQATNNEIDTLTSFRTRETLMRLGTTLPVSASLPLTAIAFDIDNLSKINDEYGFREGDHIIAILANHIKEKLPNDTLFVRMNDAVLVGLVPHHDNDTCRNMANEVIETFKKTVPFTISVSAAVETITLAEISIYELAKHAVRSLTTIKLLSPDTKHSSLVNSLIQTLRESDIDTEGHVKRTQAMGEALAKKLGLSDYTRTNLSLLCVLHDIGKIGIPLEILNKPGKLDDDEWVIMKSHVNKGYRIAMASEELADIAPNILHHHERWDGKGYPSGLKEDEIPVLSRIISIIDAYDAMVSDRIYRDACSHTAAINELKRCSGTQFDPHFVDEFINVIDELLPTIYSNSVATAKEEPTVAMSLMNNDLTFVPHCSYTLDKNWKIIKADENFPVFMGYSLKDINEFELTQLMLIPEENRECYQTVVDQEFKKNISIYLEHKIQKKDGTIESVVCFGRKTFNPITNDVCSLMTVFRKI